MNEEILHSKIYKKEGTIPILIFHGLFGMLDNWATIGKKFSEYLEVHLIDLRNHGKSFHSNQMDYELMVNDILNYMNYHNIPKAILLGHSLGGKVVMECAVKFPDLVEKLIVVDISPKAYPPHHQSILKALKSVDFSAINERKEVENIIRQYIKNTEVIQFLIKNVYRREKDKFDFRFNLEALSENYNKIITRPISFGKYEGETLFISGEKSNYILEQDKFQILQQFPHSQFSVILDAGHWVHAENPSDFYNVVYEFLTK